MCTVRRRILTRGRTSATPKRRSNTRPLTLFPCPSSLHHHYHYHPPPTTTNSTYYRPSLSITPHPPLLLQQTLLPPRHHARLPHPCHPPPQDSACISKSLTRSQYLPNTNNNNNYSNNRAHCLLLLQHLPHSTPTITSTATGTFTTLKWALDLLHLPPPLMPSPYHLRHQTTTAITTTITGSAMSPVPTVSPERPSASRLLLTLCLMSSLLSPL